jgi:uncharacterized SAM-binding protein YcdF (DUF218 family)
MDLYRYLTIPNNPPITTDCFIVLSYAVENLKNPTLPTRTIIELTYEWWQKFPKAIVIMSTGDNQGLGIPNSRVMVDYGKRIGISNNMLFEEGKSWNTYDNLRFSEKIARRHKVKHITLVTYDLHTRRTVEVARKLGWKDFFWISVSSSGSPAYGIKKFQTYSRLTIFLYELMAYLYNFLRGEL